MGWWVGGTKGRMKEEDRRRREGERGKRLLLEGKETALAAKPEEVFPIPPSPAPVPPQLRRQERPQDPGAALGSPQSPCNCCWDLSTPVLTLPLNRVLTALPFPGVWPSQGPGTALKARKPD